MPAYSNMTTTQLFNAIDDASANVCKLQHDASAYTAYGREHNRYAALVREARRRGYQSLPPKPARKTDE